jgi:uncharacterized membrane protein
MSFGFWTVALIIWAFALGWWSHWMVSKKDKAL